MANYQTIVLDTATPQLRAPGTGDGYSFDSGATNLGTWTTTGLTLSTGSLTLTPGTANGVLYLNGSKVATSGSALTFNGTALGVGTSTNNTNYLAVGGAVSVSNTYGTALLSVASNSYTSVTIASHENTTGANGTYFGLMRSRGTQASPTNLLSGDLIGSISGQVFNTAGAFPYRGSCAINLVADGNQASGDLPGRIVFSTVPAGSITLTERMRLDSSGNLGIGTTSPTQRLEVIGNALVGDGAAATRRTLTVNGGANSGIGAYIGVQIGGSLVGTLASSGWAASDTSTDLAVYADTGKSIRFYSAASERMRLDASGNLVIGTTTVAGGARVTSSGDIAISGAGTGARLRNRITAISVSTSATTIIDAGDLGQLVVVNGNDGTNRFCDLVMTATNAAPTVIESYTALGTPAARTYTRSGTNLQLALASGTYNVYALSLGF